MKILKKFIQFKSDVYHLPSKSYKLDITVKNQTKPIGKYNDDIINEGITDTFKQMLKPVAQKILKNENVKSIIKKITKMDGYEEIAKNKDKKGLAKLVKSYFDDNKEDLKTMETELKNTEV